MKIEKMICVLLALLFCVCAFSDENFRKAIDKASSYIDKKRYESAIRVLEKTDKDKDTTVSEKGEIALLLSLIYRLQEKPLEALKILELFTGSKSGRYQIELGETYLMLEKFDRALGCSTCYAKEDELLFLEAFWLRSRANFGLAKYEDCIDNCDQLIAISSERMSAIRSDIGKDEKKFLEKMIADAEELKGKAIGMNDVLLYGKDFALYRRGRKAQFNGKYDEAIVFYSQIRKGTLKDAGTVYAAACYVKKGDFDAAIKMYEEFCEEKPFSLYYGEALYNLAFLLCVKKQNKPTMIEALALSEKCVEWSRNFKAEEAMLEDINERLIRDIVSGTPDEFLQNDDCGNLIRTKLFPESITNPKTSPWYLPYYETKAGLLKGFLLSETGKKNEAAVAFKEAVTSNGKSKIVSNSGALPLLLEGLVEGFYLLPGECGNKISRKYRLKIALSCFFILTEEYDAAEQILNETLKTMGNNEKYDVCAANLCKTYILLKSNKKKEAGKILEGIIASLGENKSELSRKAKYLYASVLSSDPARKDRAVKIYEELAKDRNGYLADEAMLSLAMFSYNAGDKRTAKELCWELRRRKDSPYSAAAQTFIQAIGKTKDVELDEDGLETKTGTVIKHAKTVMIPGTPSWDIETSGLKSGDIVFYNIRCISRDNCKIIRSFSVGLSPDEPQPPQAKAGNLEFVRIPALYVKNLKYDFVKIFPELAQ
jgi:tetratricopeptide (TPR) repeat protein